MGPGKANRGVGWGVKRPLREKCAPHFQAFSAFASFPLRCDRSLAVRTMSSSWVLTEFSLLMFLGVALAAGDVQVLCVELGT